MAEYKRQHFIRTTEDMGLDEILQYAGKPVSTKQELFLRLCALNYLNALVKQDENKDVLNYGMIKPKVFYLIKNLATKNRLGLCDEIYIKPSENCAYIRCYGLQFGFHNINAKALAEEFPNLVNEEGVWDGVRLQPVAKQLYEFAKSGQELENWRFLVNDNVDEHY